MVAKDLTGQTFGKWTVLRKSSRKRYYVCKCECGCIKDVYESSLTMGKSRSCPSCSGRKPKPATTEASLVKAKKKEGQVIHGWRVIEVLPEKKSSLFLCRAICPECGKEAKVKLSRLPYITKCAECSRDLSRKVDVIHATTYVDGSSLTSISARAEGHINKNSTSGANGVCKDRNGRWRAYINFQRKQYHLGIYNTVEEAAAARKEAEELIYAPYLKEHEGWKKELADRLANLKKEKK